MYTIHKSSALFHCFACHFEYMNVILPGNLICDIVSISSEGYVRLTVSNTATQSTKALTLVEELWRKNKINIDLQTE